MFKKVMILLAVAAFAGGAFTHEAQALSYTTTGEPSLVTRISEASLRSRVIQTPTVPQGSRIGSVHAHADLGVQGYGCLAHPDYGLYTPHFC
jgi:hypothetical protein